MDDVLLNKAAIIERCLQRIEEEYRGAEDQLETNFTKQDSIVLNLQRACEASIDMGNLVVRRRRLGVPQSSRDTFALLERARLIDPRLSRNLQGMVGFRNVAVHDYQSLNLQVLRAVLERNLPDFTALCRCLLQTSDATPD